ncbi:MAG: hypothetical protein BIFFINMI_00399 [Phycisphaerae bacterium]|nr:hypothetical protein [Phycisphaerae bacterium]
MSVKHVLLIALVLANLVLLTAVVLKIEPPRQADAQVVGGGNNFAVVTAAIDNNEDVVWVINLKTRQLSVLRMPQGAGKTLTLMDTRNLLKDIRGNR